MTIKKMPLSIAYVAILILITACQSTKPLSAGATGGSEMLYKYQWEVTELQGQTLAVTSGNQPYLLFYPGQVGRVSGSTGCNKLNGSFELTGVNFINFSSPVTTKMACNGDNVEAKFLEALAKANNWSITGDQLLINSGKLLLVKLKPVPPKLK